MGGQMSLQAPVLNFLGIYSGVELLDHVVILWLIFWGRALRFPKMAALLYTYTSRIQGFLFLYVLANICYFLSSIPPFLPPSFPSFLPFSLLQERDEEGEATCFSLCPLAAPLPRSWVLCLPLIVSPHFQRRGLHGRASWYRNLTVSGFMVPVGKSSVSSPLSPQSLSVHVNAHTCVKYKWMMRDKSRLGDRWVTSIQLIKYWVF